MTVLGRDFGDQFLQGVCPPPQWLHQHTPVFDGEAYRAAFFDSGLFRKSFGDSQRQAVAPLLNHSFHNVATKRLLPEFCCVKRSPPQRTRIAHVTLVEIHVFLGQVGGVHHCIGLAQVQADVQVEFVRRHGGA